MAVQVEITCPDRYIRVLRPDGTLLSRHLTIEDAIESAVNAGGEFRIVYPDRIVKAFGILSPSNDTIPPTVPGNLTASTVSAVAVSLSWTASSDNVGVAGYQVWRNNAPIGTTGATSYTDTGLAPSTTYTYHVSAYDAAGNASGLSNSASATTAANAAPVWNVAQQELTTNVGYSLDLTSVCTDANGTTPTFSIVSGTLPAGVAFNAVARTVSGTPSTVETRSVTFRASDGVATTDQAITFRVLNADVTAPSAPTSLAGSGTGGERIELTWTAAVDPTVANARTTGVAAYKVYRDGALRATLGNVLAYSDTAVAADTQYAYTVTAVDAAGNESAASNTATVSTAAFGWTIPDVPYAVTTPTSGELVAGQAWTYDVSQHVNLAGQTAAYSISSTNPSTAGITIDSSTGLITGQVASASSYSVQVNLTEAVTTTGDLPTLTVSSSTGAWTFGQPIKKGAAVWLQGPAGTQVEIRNRWADGSAKFAVISGVNVGTVTPTATANNPYTSGEVALSSSPASVTFTGAVTGTYACPTSNTVSAWSKSTAHLVRKITGPVMTERHYYVPTTDAHVAVWFHVRSYSNGATWVETIIENGWARVAGAAEKVYGVTVNVGGTQRYSASLVHYHHTRWSRQDWVVPQTEITPVHDGAYLKATKLVPNYSTPAISTTLLNSYPTTPAPFNRFSYDIDSDAGGAASHIGLLPGWEAAYIQSGDVRAYRAMLCNEQAANCCNYESGASYGGANIRDEATGLPIVVSDYYGESYSNGPTGAGHIVPGVNTTVNAAASAAYGAPVTRVWKNNEAHGASSGYLAYLTTGRWFSLETCQMLEGIIFLCGGVSTWTTTATDGPWRRWGEDRGIGWGHRNIATALCITPDTQTTVRNGYIDLLEKFWNRWRTVEVGFNNLGVRLNIYNNADYGPAPYNTVGAFQQQFLTQSFAFGYDIASELVGSTARTQWLESIQFHCKFPVGLLGTRPGGYCYRRSGRYGLVIGADRTKPLDSSDFYADFGTVYDVNVSLGEIPVETCADGSTLLYNSSEETSATSYFGNMRPAAAYAVDFGVTGASAAWSRFTGSSSWAAFYANAASAPQFAVSPR